MSAAAATPPPAVPRRLVASTYRQLLRLTLRFDLDPAFRALVCVYPSTVFSADLRCWRGIARNSGSSPVEQYLEDVLRFANATSDFHVSDPDNVSAATWTALAQLYPAKRFSVASTTAAVETASSASPFAYYPLSYLARPHFRGGPELQQFKTEMQAQMREVYIKTTGRGMPPASSAASSSASASSSVASPQDTASSSRAQDGDASKASAATGLGSPAVQPSAAQLGSAFQCVRWMRNLTQVVRTDHPLHGRVSRGDVIPTRGGGGGGAAKAVTSSSSSPPADAACDDAGELKLLPCYRASLRHRWRETAGFAAEDDVTAAVDAAEDQLVDPEVPPLSEEGLSRRRADRGGDAEGKSRDKVVASSSSSSSTATGDVAALPASGPYVDRSGVTWVDVPAKVDGTGRNAFLLCAHPIMPGFFQGNLLLMHQFDPDSGAVGIAFNRPLRNNDGIPVPVWAVFAQHASAPCVVLRHLEDNRIFIGGPISACPSHVGAAAGSGRGGEGQEDDDASASPSRGSGRGGARGASRSRASGGAHQHGADHSFLSAAHYLHRIPGVPGALPIAPGCWWGGDQLVIGQRLEAKAARPCDVMVIIGFASWAPKQLEGEIANGSWISAISQSAADDRTHELRDVVPPTRPFASPSAAVADQPPLAGEPATTTSDASSTATTPPKPPLATRFDTIADFIFASNVPVSKEERIFDFSKEPDPMAHTWRQFVRRLGAPSLTRLAELSPDGSWMASMSADGKNADKSKK